jgi:DNA-binding MarR family transcriptional regulator
MPIPEVARPSPVTETHSLVDALVQASFAVMAVLSKVAAEHDLSLTQLRVLAILRDRTVRMSDLAEHMGLDKSTISGLIDRAETRGLVRREPSPDDKRAVDVFLAADGARLAELGGEQVARALSPMMGRLTRAEALRLTALLEQVIDPGE